MTKRAPDRDASIDRLMRGALESRPLNAPTDACLDADTLAAWADAALTSSAREAVESHAADCASCQALLAAMARTAPQTAAPSRRWRLTRMPWLVPLAGAAAAAILWFAVPTRPLISPAPLPPAPSSARALQTDRPAAPSTESNAAPTAPPVNATPSSSPATGARRSAPASADSKDASSNSPAAQLDAKAARDRAAAESADATAPVPQTAPTQPLAETVIVPSPAPAAAAPTPSQAGARPAAKAAPFSANETAQSAAPLLKTEARAEDASARPTIMSPNPAARWRIEANGVVQHSEDGGVTWTRQQTGVSETLTAGSSPSASVCWLVGPHGVVLRSTDGRSWHRIGFPEAIALMAITAADEQTATVTTADGRRFSTTDGGGTWIH